MTNPLRKFSAPLANALYERNQGIYENHLVGLNAAFEKGGHSLDELMDALRYCTQLLEARRAGKDTPTDIEK